MCLELLDRYREENKREREGYNRKNEHNREERAANEQQQALSTEAPVANGEGAGAHLETISNF